jgi:hypothetical protein
MVELAAQRLNVGIHVAFGFDLAENLTRKLKIAVGERLGRAL